MNDGGKTPRDGLFEDRQQLRKIGDRRTNALRRRERCGGIRNQAPAVRLRYARINGDSYRMRAHRDAIRALRPAITGGEKP